MVFKFLILRENTELIPSSDSYELSPGNNVPTDGTTLVLVGIPTRNQLGCVEVAKEELA